MLLFSFRKRDTHQAHPELRLCQEQTSSRAGADGDSSHQLSRLRWHGGDTDLLPLLLQDQGLTAGGSQGTRAYEVKKCIQQQREKRNRCRSHGWDSGFKVAEQLMGKEQEPGFCCRYL